MMRRKAISELKDLKRERILAFAAHPDDLEFYIGGTIAKLSKGNKVDFVIATSGENGSRRKNVSNDKVRSIRKTEQRKATKLLGVKAVEFSGFQDGELLADLKLRRKVIKAINKYKPSILFTFDPWNINQIHPDHRAIGFAVLDLVIRANIKIKSPISIRSIYLYDTLKPNVFSDITNYWDKKIQANKAHKSQFLEFRSGWEEKREILEKIGKMYGGVINTQFAEAFRKIEIDPSVRYINNAFYSLQHL